MIISRTPLRISFVGGGSDLPIHYRRYGGAVISCSIDKYVFVMVNKRFEEGVRVSYSRTEAVANADAIEHPLVRETMRKLGMSAGVEITSVADVPAKGSGLGSSSAFTVGLLHALYAYNGVYRSRIDLGREACEIEIDICNEPIGKQDQYAAAVGGLNNITFNCDDTVDIEALVTPPEFLQKFEDSLMMYYTGIVRSASAILKEQAASMAADVGKSNLVRDMAELVTPFRMALHSGDLRAIGEILHTGWELKSSVSSAISNPVIADMYRRGRSAGAHGGKLLGAGGGGFVLFCVPSERKEAVRQAMLGYREVPIGINWTGSTIVFCSPPTHS